MCRSSRVSGPYPCPRVLPVFPPLGVEGLRGYPRGLVMRVGRLPSRPCKLPHSGSRPQCLQVVPYCFPYPVDGAPVVWTEPHGLSTVTGHPPKPPTTPDLPHRPYHSPMSDTDRLTTAPNPLLRPQRTETSLQVERNRGVVSVREHCCPVLDLSRLLDLWRSKVSRVGPGPGLS